MKLVRGDYRNLLNSVVGGPIPYSPADPPSELFRRRGNYVYRVIEIKSVTVVVYKAFDFQNSRPGPTRCNLAVSFGKLMPYSEFLLLLLSHFTIGGEGDMKKKLFRATFMALTVVFAVSLVFAGSARAQDQDAPQIGMILAGSLGDQSFADAAYSGLKAAERQYGIGYDYVEAPSGAVEEFGRIARVMAKRNKYDIIIAESSFAAEPIKEVSKDYPDQEFMVIDAAVEGRPNVASIIYKQNEGSFLVGVVAAVITEMDMDKTNPDLKVGFVGGMEIPVIEDFYLGYKAGVEWVNPDIEVVSKYIGSFDDVSGAKEAALSMYANKVDIIYHAAGQTGLGVFEAAAEENKLAIGVDSPQAYLQPNHIVTSMIKRVEASVIDTARALSEGVFEPSTIYVYGVETGVGPSGIAGVGESTSSVTLPDPGKVIDKVEEARKKIINDEITVPGALPWTQYEQKGARYPWYE